MGIYLIIGNARHELRRLSNHYIRIIIGCLDIHIERRLIDIVSYSYGYLVIRRSHIARSMPLVCRLTCKYAVLIPFTCKDNILCQSHALEVAADLVDVAVPLIVLRTGCKVFVIDKILNIPLHKRLEYSLRIVTMHCSILIIGSLIHQIPIIIDAIMVRSHNNIHDVVFLSHH